VKPLKIKIKRRSMAIAYVVLIGCAALITLAWIATLIWVVVRLVS
jgi:hypothetical protein